MMFLDPAVTAGKLVIMKMDLRGILLIWIFLAAELKVTHQTAEFA